MRHKLEEKKTELGDGGTLSLESADKTHAHTANAVGFCKALEDILDTQEFLGVGE